MASGDLGAPAYRKFDVEAWMPGLGRYGEVWKLLSLFLFSIKLFPVGYGFCFCIVIEFCIN